MATGTRIYSFILLLFVTVMISVSCVDFGGMFDDDFKGGIALTLEATEINDTSAILNARVQPNSELLRVSFLLTDNINDIAINGKKIKANPDSFLPGKQWYTTSAKATGLQPKTAYRFAVFIENDYTICESKFFTTK